MRKIEIHPGRVFGRYTVMGHAYASGPEISWLCQCSCGSAPRSIRGSVLRNRAMPNCGCVRAEGLISRNTKHGKSGSREYRSWQHMKERCLNPDADEFHNYGARGIKICARWSEFAAFYADMGNCPPGMKIERIDNNGSYEPGNCRWATQAEQARNTRVNQWVILNGERMVFTDACKRLGITLTAADTLRSSRSISHQRAVDYYVERAAIGAEVKPRDDGGKFCGRSGWSLVRE